jgi:nucleoside-diphosphate-sugar epimerase
VVFNRHFSRSFLHVVDACRSILAILEGPLKTLRAEVFNVGSERGNFTKDQVAAIVQRAIRGTRIEYADAEPAGDMRDLQVSFAKIRRVLGFEPAVDVEAGVREIRDCLESGVIPMGQSGVHRNAERVLN